MDIVKQGKAPLYDAIKKYIKRDMIPFHMPGHLQGRGVPLYLKKLFGREIFNFDLTEIPGLDYLHYARGVIKEAEELAAELYGVRKTYFLINGATAGIHTMILATCKKGDKIIIGGNAHRSVIGGIIESGANPVFVNSEFNKEFGIITNVTPDVLEKIIRKNLDAKAVLITTPNYYGIQGDIKRMIDIIHKYHMYALIDEAHGAHFPFHPAFPESAIAYGADMVVQSAHKTLPTLTQTALLHIVTDMVNTDMVEQLLAMVESSSPSYIFMAVLDVVRREMAINGRSLWEKAIETANYAREEIKNMNNFKVIDKSVINGKDIYAVDPIKLIINVQRTGFSGFEFENYLNKHRIEIELSDLQNILLFVIIGTVKKDIDILLDALKTVKIKESKIGKTVPFPKAGEQIYSPEEAFNMDYKLSLIDKAVGKVNWGIVAPYPPGVFVLVPGMRISEEAVGFIRMMQRNGGMVQGAVVQGKNIYIRVVKN